MSPITRMWLGFAGVSVGLIHAALAVGAPLPLAVALCGLAAIELAWGVAMFVRGRIDAPLAVVAIAVAPVLGWASLSLAAAAADSAELASALRLGPFAIAAIFELFVAIAVARHVRAGARAAIPAGDREMPAIGYLGALFAGALSAALLVTPALAGTEAGRFAQPHGDHSADFEPVDDSPVELELPDHH